MVASPRVLRLGGHDLVTKPLDAREIRRVLERVTESEAARQPTESRAENGEARTEIPDLIGLSERMRKIHRLIGKVALKRHPVLILGESGTGKELVARAIHQLGPWSEQPFVPVDCGALTPTLIESELFGHVRGAFTGAQQARTGLLAAAGAGTVFLDEIGELPIELQSKMLRALQEKEVKPLGSNERVRFEARIIAATNQDLEAAFKRGTFRKDLYFRLNVVSIKLPPLRERKGDIPVLVRHFIARYADRTGPAEVSDEVLGRLMSYEWPGNIRELENCIQRAVALGAGPIIQMQDLPSSMIMRLSGTPSSRRELSTLQSLERRAILQALEATGGDRVRAAKLLGIGKTTIYRKLKEYGLENFSASSASA
jgi:DNA-binding NtrC family response regulator